MKTFNTGGLIKYYGENAKKFGDSIKTPAWGSRESQETRFRILSEIANLQGKSLLDVGCGLGDFLGWLKKRHTVFSYSGLDITPSVISIARKKYPAAGFRVGSIFDITITKPAYDYVFASGIFNRKIAHHEKFIKDTVLRMFDAAREGIAFNIMSTRADFKRKNEYYADAGEIVDFCLKISRKTVLRHDYMPHDFTVYVYKEKHGRK